jgi:hypothetical protein
VSSGQHKIKCTDRGTHSRSLGISNIDSNIHRISNIDSNIHRISNTGITDNSSVLGITNRSPYYPSLYNPHILSFFCGTHDYSADIAFFLGTTIVCISDVDFTN